MVELHSEASPQNIRGQVVFGRLVFKPCPGCIGQAEWGIPIDPVLIMPCHFAHDRVGDLVEDVFEFTNLVPECGQTQRDFTYRQTLDQGAGDQPGVESIIACFSRPHVLQRQTFVDQLQRKRHDTGGWLS